MNRASKTMLILSAGMGLQMTSYVLVLPLFARRFAALGAGVEALGMSEMAYALTGTLAAPWMGALADRFGRKPLALISLAAGAAAICGYGLARSVLALVLIRGLAGALAAGLAPAVFGMAAGLAPADRKAQWMGFLSGGASLGWIAGPVAGGLVFDHWGFEAALLVSLLLIGLTGLLLLALPNNHPAARAEGGPASGSGLGRSWRAALPQSLPSFAALLGISFVVLFAWSFIEPRFLFYAYNDLGWSSSLLGLVMSTYGIALMAGELALGGLSDRWGRRPVILLGLALFSAQFVGLALFHSRLLIGVMFMIAGLGNALYDPALSAAVLDMTRAEHRSRMLGVKSMVGSAGTILGPALAALLGSAVPARTVFLLAVGIVAAAVLAAVPLPNADSPTIINNESPAPP